MGDDDPSDEDRAAILRRRAVFVASAVAGLGLAAGCAESAPRPCLDISVPEPSGQATAQPTQSAEPQACLQLASPPQPCLDLAAPEDAGLTGIEDGGRDAGQPRPCLRKAPPAPPPKPCLKVAPPPQACLDMPVPSDDGD